MICTHNATTRDIYILLPRAVVERQASESRGVADRPKHLVAGDMGCTFKVVLSLFDLRIAVSRLSIEPHLL